MKRVLILTNSISTIIKFRSEVVEKLLEIYDVYLLIPETDGFDDLAAKGLNVLNINLDRRGKNLLSDLKLLHQYKKAINSIGPDIVLTYTIKPNIYGNLAAKKYKVPVISTITGLGTAVENSGLMSKVTCFLYRLAFNKRTRVFFQNEENRQFFIDKKINIDNSVLVPGSGVNLEKFQLAEYPTAEIVQFVFIARIMKEKGIDQYLEAAEYIKGKYPNTVFNVGGFCEQNYVEKLNDLHDKGIIKYHGSIANVSEFLKDIHCTIHPTYYPEGMSNVLLESCATGRPIITTDRSGCREIVDDGVNGYIVKQQDTKDLINKIEQFLQLSYKEKRQMGLNGRFKVECEFDRKDVTNKYVIQVSKEVNEYEFKG